MLLQKVIELTESLEDPKHPLLGPCIKGLRLFGLWQTENNFIKIAYNVLHISAFFFVISQFTEMNTNRNDINKVLNNMSLTVLSMICLAKTFSYVSRQSEWKALTNGISEEELLQMKKQDEIVMKLMAKYTKYTRIVTYMFWIMVLVTNTLLILTPLIKYLTSKKYQAEIREGLEPPPHIISSWFPFSTSHMPGYIIAVIVHVVMGNQGAGVLAVYDMNAVSIMSYLKGQLAILKAKCEGIFDDAPRETVLDRIKECHRHHNILVRHYNLFNSLLSPIMYLYVLICSITICCSVVQFISNGATTSQKIWVIQYTTGQIFQLFLYCWHSNEVLIESRDLDQGVYQCDWWKGNVVLRRQVLLLAGKLTHPFILNAGPYTSLSVPTFIDIMKGSYSFFTLFSQMQDNK